MKIGVIRCLKKESECIGKTCLDFIKNRKNHFKNMEKIELIGLLTCGGCPGKKISVRAEKMINDGADKVVLTSCITDGTCRDLHCSYFDTIKSSLVITLEPNQVIYSTI